MKWDKRMIVYGAMETSEEEVVVVCVHFCLETLSIIMNKHDMQHNWPATSQTQLSDVTTWAHLLHDILMVLMFITVHTLWHKFKNAHRQL